MQNLLFSLQTVGPAFLIILVGFFLRKIKLIDADFITKSTKIVFNIALPSLIFIKISQTDFGMISELKEIPFGCIGITISFIFALIVALFLVRDEKKRGVFIQGAFRGNYAIIGMALLATMYGESGLYKGAIILSFALPVFNILAITGLTISMHKLNLDGIKTIGIKVITNPNVIAVLVGIIFSYFKIPIHIVLTKTINNLSALALPLALIGIGGTLTVSNIKENFKLGMLATIIKIVITPLVFTLIAIKLGIRGENLTAIFLLFAVPTAVSSFIFAKAMDGDENLATNILLFTTIGSMFTISIGLFILKANGLID